jgi:hypothetical protein
VLAEHHSDGSGAVGKKDVQGYDLLSLLIKSNIAADVPESMRMDDSEILSRERFCSSPDCLCLKHNNNNIYFRDPHVPDCRS